MSLEPWQSFLDSLTQNAAEENILGRIKNKNEEKVVNSCLGGKSYRSKLLKWMDGYLEQSSITKSCEDSVKYRTRGNEEFKTHNDKRSLHLYSKSILIAPHNSEEFAMGLGNRSAVLFEMKLYELCSRDINMALQSKSYPKNLLHKLLLRQARCLNHLHSYEECQDVLNTLCDHLKDNSITLPQKKLDEINEEIDVIRCSVITDQKVPPPSLHDLTKASWETPLPKGGFNASFPSASCLVELKVSQKKGRHVVATVPFNQGDIIFVEKPYVSVVLPDQYMLHCHHCSKRMFAPIPCANCCQALFCSLACQKEASLKYHSYECGALPMMWSVGIAHLGLRTLLVTGPPEDVIRRVEKASLYFATKKGTSGNPNDPYSAVFGLLSHVESMFPEDAFQYTMTAILLTEYLRTKTSYFGALCDSEETTKKICSIILRHITQLVCNAHALTKVDDDCESVLDDGGVVGESQQRIATAIYPAASMMNHSCDPNISNSFHNNTLIVKASRNIAAGEEIFNCYGPHRARMSTGDRQAALLAQYFFHCACSACEPTSPETDDAQERCSALCCATCKGPLLSVAPGRQPAGAKEAAFLLEEDVDHDNDRVSGGHSVHRMVCADCGSSQTISSQVEGSFRARYLFKQGLEASRAGDVNKALYLFLDCRDIQQTCLYRTHRDLAATQDQIAKCYAVLGKYSDCIPCLWEVIASNDEQFGKDSVEVGHELKKLSDVMMHDIRSSNPKEQNEKRVEAKRVMERAQKIFGTQYGEWDANWQEMNAKLQGLQIDSLR